MIGGFFNNYPYTDFHELNLDWILKTIMALQSDMKTFVNVNTIKYADPLQWNIASQYEQNTLVQDALGMTYLSKQPVPAGISISNIDYWLKVADFDAYVEVLKKAITQYDEGSGTTATVSHQPGDLVWLSNELYQVTAAMIPGDTYVPGSNCRIVTIAELLDNTGLFSNFEDAVTFENEGASTTATAARAVGDVLWVQDVLYKVISPMIPGDTYVPGSNIDKVSIFELFANLLTLNNVNIGGDLQYKDPVPGTYYDTVEVNDTNGVPYKVMIENGNTGNLGSRSQKMTSRPKLGWYSGTKTRAWTNKFYMNGFRFMGQNYKEGSKLYTSGNLPYTLFDHDTDIDVVDAFNGDCWYALFVVPDHDDVCKPVCIPILRVTSVTGDTLALAATKLNTVSTPLSSNLLADLAGRDVLIINGASNNINGEVAKIIASTPSTITLDGTYDVGVDSYILIAPEGDEYGYVGSHYTDTNDWKNRQDNGYAVKYLPGAGRGDTWTHNTNIYVQNKNDWSPLASGLIYQMSCSLSTTGTGGYACYCGPDNSHKLTEYYYDKISTSTVNPFSPLISTMFDYLQQIAVEFHCSWATPINMDWRCHGWYEA